MSNICPGRCEYGSKLFTFSDEMVTFTQARSRCTLAKNLNRRALSMINTCCQNQVRYWIGLEKSSSCGSNRTHPLNWLGEKKCRSTFPFQNLNVQDHDRCQAILLQVNTPGSDVPHAFANECPTNLRYICQETIPQRTPKKTTTPSKTAPRKTTTAKSVETTTTPLSRAVSDVSNTDSIDAGTIAAVVVSLSLLLLIMLLILYLWKYKRTDLKKLKRFGINKQSIQSHPPVFPNLSAVVEAPVYCNFDTNAAVNLTYEGQISPAQFQPYAMTEVVQEEANDYQAIAPPNRPDSDSRPEYENDSMQEGYYNKLALHPENADNVDNPVSVQNDIIEEEPSGSNAVQSESVEYTTVRPLNQPSEIYAEVDKSKKATKKTEKRNSRK